MKRRDYYSQKRCDNEYRDYSEDDLKRLEKILIFRKCNISIENIRLIFNGVKNLDEVFKEQISVIENEVKQLNGAKIMCKKLSQEKSSVDTLDTDKYINIINSEEQKGNRFYDIADDYIFATEKLYQSIIENKEFKGGDSNFDLNTIFLINDWHEYYVSIQNTIGIFAFCSRWNMGFYRY